MVMPVVCVSFLIRSVLRVFVPVKSYDTSEENAEKE